MNRLIRRLLRNESGTALTEFIITLPVFIAVFSFSLAFYTKTHEVNRIRMRAATEMWDNAMDVHRQGTGYNFDHMQPLIAAGNALSIINGSRSFAGDINQTLMAASLFTMDSGNEMVVGSMQLLGPTTNPNSKTNKKFATLIGEDGMLPPGLPSNNAVMVFVPAMVRSIGVTRHAGIIGTRYGMVQGQNSGTVTVANWGPAENFTATYDVLVSPISYPGGFTDEFFVVGTSRLLADQDPCLKTVLEISTSMSDC